MRAATLAGFALALGASAALAADTPKPALLSAQDYLPEALLPEPPADGSAGAAAELAELRRIEHDRSAAAFAKAAADDKAEDAGIFAEAIGPGFDLRKLPATARLLATVRVEEKAAAKAAKDHFARNRPWIVDPMLKPCASDDAPKSSYPSGHATMGYSMAVVLARLEPAHAQAVMDRAAVYAENRLVCSMHFRSDIVAGQALGTAVAIKLMDDPAFRRDFDAAAAELRAAGL